MRSIGVILAGGFEIFLGILGILILGVTTQVPISVENQIAGDLNGN